jgi:crossover junction endodeoxyribonuclease RuvC
MILALDLSLTAMGIATLDDELRAWTFKAKGEGLPRLKTLRAECASWAREADFVVLEGPSYDSKFGKSHERAGLWWLVRERLDRDAKRVAIAPPSSVKLYAAGSGNASKDAVLVAAAKKFAGFEGDNNAADAAWMVAMAADHLGFPLLADVPAKNRKALDGVSWP